MRISKFVNVTDETPLHTSGFAEVASQGMGAVSPESFTARQQRASARTAIGGYNRSMMGQSMPARKYQQPASRSISVAKPMTGQPRFQEPGGRGYNPYG